MIPSTNDSGLMAPKVVAARLGISTSLLYGLIQRGDIPAIRVGKKLLKIGQADVEAFLARRRNVPAS